MNNKYASCPDTCKDYRELQLFLSTFSPYYSRYHVDIPHNWDRFIKENISTWNDAEKKRGMELLSRARNDGSLIKAEAQYISQETWNPANTWLENTAPLLNNDFSDLDGIFAAPTSNRNTPPQLYTLDQLPFQGTEEETVTSQPPSIVKACEVILKNQPELIFVDPFLDLRQSRVFSVVEQMLLTASKGVCESIRIYARTQNVGRNKKEIKANLTKLTKPFKHTPSVSYYCLDDKATEQSIHDRFLFSIRGGIRISYGFQSVKIPQKTDIAPLNKKRLAELIDQYHLQTNNLIIDEKICF